MVYLSLHNSSGTLIDDVISQNVTITTGGSYTLVRPTTPIRTAPGTYLILTKYKDANGVFHALNTSNYTIQQAAACVNGSGNTPAQTSDEWKATQYLCENNIINSNQNWDNNATQAMLRMDIAKIAYLGIYKGASTSQMNSPALSFPVPFSDMQSIGNPYWYDAAKVLAYLQFNDDKTPFDRDFINFRPDKPIMRAHAIKLFLEAFNILPATSGAAPFDDVPTSHDMFGWIKKAKDLGIVTGNTNNCNGTCFHPSDYITRRDAFIILWRILTATNITRPSISQLNDASNYYIPGNYTLKSMMMAPGLGQGNFNHYQKTSFSIAGRSSIPLDFTHTYNSFMTELPKGYFEYSTNNQSFTPLGIGWTHTYNIYGVKVEGYNDGTFTEPDKIMFFYPDGSINTFNYNTNQPDGDGVGVYDVMSKTAITNGTRVTITTKNQIKYTFENVNNGEFFFIKSIKDRNDNGVNVNWQALTNGSYRIATVQEVFYNNTTGRSLTFNYMSASSPYLSSISDNSINRTISFSVSATTRSLTSYKDPKGQTTNYTYDDFNNYNKSNLLIRIQLPKGNKIENTYEDRKLTSSKTFSQNNVVSSTTKVNWQPSYSGSTYNSSSTVTDPSNRTTNYSYNSNGDATQVTTPSNTMTVNSFASGKNAHLATSITVDGITSTMAYDNNGNLTSISKNGITNTYVYTAKNDVATHTDGRGNTTSYNYDTKGNLTRIQRPGSGGSVDISRNAYGQVASVSNPSNIQTSYGYDANGLPNQVSMPLNITTSATYDNASRLLSTTDANGKTTNYQYDVNSNLIKSTDPNGGIVNHTYDANDNHLTIKNPKNETQTNTYNFDDDLLASESFGPHTKTYTYNADGSLATFTRGNGTFTYTYEANTGRLLNDGQTQYTYDTRGNVKTISNTNGTLNLYYDNNDRMTSYQDYYGQTVAYSYDNNNNVISITYPGNKTVNYTYDANNRCTGVTDWNNKTTTYTYLTDDRVSQINLPNGTKAEYDYDAAGRLTSINNKKSDNTIISSYSFTLDNGGNHLSETIDEPSLSAGLQNITAQTINYGSYPNNRINTQGSTSFTHNTAGAITQKSNNNFTYDLNDNLLTVSGGFTAQYQYDGAGNRRQKIVSGSTTRYVLDILEMSQVLMENNGSNSVQYYYVYGPTGLLYRIKNSGNTYQYYHYDFRGSTTAITNDAQAVTHSYSYDPYGKVLVSTEADFNPYRYVGSHGVAYENDNLYFMRARYYDPGTGRFVSEDPVWALNLYPYGGNNPIMGIDPKGEFTLGVGDFIDITTFEGKLVIISATALYESKQLLKQANQQVAYGNYWYNKAKFEANRGNNRIARAYYINARRYYSFASSLSQSAQSIARQAQRDMIKEAIGFTVNMLVSKGLEKTKIIGRVNTDFEEMVKRFSPNNASGYVDIIKSIVGEILGEFF